MYTALYSYFCVPCYSLTSKNLVFICHYIVDPPNSPASPCPPPPDHTLPHNHYHVFCICMFVFAYFGLFICFGFVCLSVWSISLLVFHLLCLYFSVWLIFLRIMPLMSIHVVTNSKSSSFYDWVVFLCMCMIFFSYSSVAGHLGCFHILGYFA